MELLRVEREENEEMMRAMDAFEHAEMIPLETVEERSHREKILEERNRAGVPRTHRAACKKIESEANVPIHYCGEMNLICEECGAKHLKENGRKTRNFRNVAKRAESFFHLKKSALNLWRNSCRTITRKQNTSSRKSASITALMPLLRWEPA
jgi:hypothetical protein